MLITRETDYAFRLIRNLGTEEQKSISSIIEKELISSAIAYKVARKLEQAGLITSVRGNVGGYKLTRDPDQITLYDVYVIMNPDAAVNDCLREGAECPLNTEDSPCAVHYELERIQEALYAEMRRYSLAEIYAKAPAPRFPNVSDDSTASGSPA